MRSKCIQCFEENDRVTVRKLWLCDEKRKRLASVGLQEGAEVSVFLKEKEKMILKTGNRKIALSEKILQRIFVAPIL